MEAKNEDIVNYRIDGKETVEHYAKESKVETEVISLKSSCGSFFDSSNN